jgi:hypothetical protein
MPSVDAGSQSSTFVIANVGMEEPTAIRGLRYRDELVCLEQLTCDPMEDLAQIAMDEGNTVEIRLRAYSELAP